MTDAAHRLRASPETVHWGWFDAALAPRLTVPDGATVTVECVSGVPGKLPDGFAIPPELPEIHARNERLLPGHILTGPIAVEGAAPGDMLEVRIEDVKLRTDWGYNFTTPISGTLPEDFPEPRHVTIPLDRERMAAKMPWGRDLPLSPFFGVMGVAPPPSWGRIGTIVPRAHGGNLDNRELKAGATLFLPVFAAGANFSCGDGHAAQGDGEVNVTAIETSLEGTFTFIVHKGAGATWPRAETPTHFITMGIDPDLDRCAERALREMIALLGAKAGLSAPDAYMLCSLAAELRITQTVNGSKGVHCMLARGLVEG
jgi:acetamidase/formamidase